MDIFNTEKQFTSFHLNLDWDRLGSLLESSDAHLIVTSYDGIPLDDDVSGQYQIRLFMDLELVAICNVDEYNGISDVELHPSFVSHRQLITQLFSGYLNAPEFLFEISEFNVISLIVRQALRDGQYAVHTLNGDEVLLLHDYGYIAALSFSAEGQKVSFTSELVIGSPIYSDKLTSEILDSFGTKVHGLTKQVKAGLIEKVKTLNEDLRFDRVPRAMLMTKEPLFVSSIFKDGEV
ncbi:hypothetical protein NB568_12430 [Vibrio alginolyticus]|uniref:hypothetical protein n=1 Tax=Vibrio TaxID=662 RepID=UPI000420BA0E|nr:MULTISPECIES: hypothetical protein [Vibrio]AVF65439.1 hypothetical protein AL541_14105 [Vibrio alginolyticus]EIQ1513223.1 hypothetical protein [Vibrio parahaemolyticus]EIV8505637.1 hypothetical protein [Vibrio parahaemolyticus]EJT1886543.1 hypothetical protein [Vibrio parahaemolyticus]ELA7161282.1 hypothetical protein [Vibrio parahaemolyticus]